MQQRVHFPGSTGELLAGRLHPPTGDERAWALFAHCFTCTKDIRAARSIAVALAARGVGVLRFDFTGLGESEGEFAETNFSSNVADLVAAAAWLRGTHRAPSLLVGHSLGGAASIAAAASLPEVRAVATVAAPADLTHLVHTLRTPAVALRGEDTVRIGPGVFRIRQQLLDDLAVHRLEAHLRDLGRPLLVLHSPADATVPADHARRLFAAARHPKSFVSLGDADHLLSARGDGDWVAGIIAAWSARYV